MSQNNISPQNFIPSSDFPTKILRFMKSNASPKMALKLMKCNKFFQYSEFPYFVIQKIQYSCNEWYLFTLDGKMLNYQNFQDFKNVITQKLWITEEINLSHFSNLMDQLIPKIAVCDINSLRLENGSIKFNEFKFLTTSGNIKYLLLRGTKIYFENNDPVLIDDIFKCVPDVENFYCYNGQIPILSPNFINAMKKFDTSNLSVIGLNLISYADFEIFSDFMDKNPHIKYELFFIENSLSPEETQILENFVQTIIEFRLDIQYPPSYISFPGQTDEQLEELYLLIHQYSEKK